MKYTFRLTYLAHHLGVLTTCEREIHKKLKTWSLEWCYVLSSWLVLILISGGALSAVVFAAAKLNPWLFFISGGLCVLGLIMFAIVSFIGPDYDELQSKYCQEELEECAEWSARAVAAKDEYWAEYDAALKDRARRVLDERDAEALFEILKHLEGNNGKDSNQ